MGPRTLTCVTVIGALGGVVDGAAALAAAGLLGVGGTIAARNRRPGPVRLRGRVVPHSRLLATWMVATGVWGLLVAGKRAGLIPVSGLLLVALVPVCLGLLARLLVRGQHAQHAQLLPARTDQEWSPAACVDVTSTPEAAPGAETARSASAGEAETREIVPGARGEVEQTREIVPGARGEVEQTREIVPGASGEVEQTREIVPGGLAGGREGAAVGPASLPKAREPAPTESADLEKTS